MKIGVDARPLTVPTFGIGRYTHEILSRMVQLARDDTWFLYADRPLKLPFEAANIEIRDFPNHNRVMSLGRTQLTFAHWANKDKLDVFWSPRHHLPLLLSPHIRKIVTIHDLVWQKFPETMQRANLMIEKALMPRSVRLADRVIAVSEATREDVIAAFNLNASHVDVIYEAAAPASANSSAREIETPYFLFIGTHEPRKNLKRLVAAFDAYRSRGGTIKLVLVGASGWGASDQVTATDEDIHKLGYVSDQRLDSLIQHAHALVMPSLYEGFGLPIAEALQRGVPVITSNVSAMPEVAGDAGLLVNPLDIDAITNALLEMTESEVHSRCAAACASQSGRFDWGRAAQQTLDVIAAG